MCFCGYNFNKLYKNYSCHKNGNFKEMIVGNCSARCVFVATILTNYTKTILATKMETLKK